MLLWRFMLCFRRWDYLSSLILVDVHLHVILIYIAISSGYGKHIATLTSNQAATQLKAGFSVLFSYLVPGQLDSIYTFFTSFESFDRCINTDRVLWYFLDVLRAVFVVLFFDDVYKACSHDFVLQNLWSPLDNKNSHIYNFKHHDRDRDWLRVHLHPPVHAYQIRVEQISWWPLSRQQQTLHRGPCDELPSRFFHPDSAFRAYFDTPSALPKKALSHVYLLRWWSVSSLVFSGSIRSVTHLRCWQHLLLSYSPRTIFHPTSVFRLLLWVSRPSRALLRKDWQRSNAREPHWTRPMDQYWRKLKPCLHLQCISLIYLPRDSWF